MAGPRQAAEVAFRLAVLQASDLPPVWERPSLAAAVYTCDCARPTPTGCRHPEVCLAAALVTDDPSPYRAGMSRAHRQRIFAELVDQAVAFEPLLAGHAGRPACTLPHLFAMPTP